MRPLRRFIMPLIAPRVVWNAPFRLASSTASQSSSLSRSRMLSRVRPALLTRMSIGPERRFRRGKRRSDLLRHRDVAARRRRRARPAPPPPSRARSASRPTIATFAPAPCSARAMARPMPRVLPVTKATLPVRSMAWHHARNFSTSSAVPSVDRAARPGTIRLSRPDSTLPGPTSTNVASGASSAAARMQATQRTGAVSWSASRRFASDAGAHRARRSRWR